MAINQLTKRPRNSFLASKWISNQSNQVSFSYHTQYFPKLVHPNEIPTSTSFRSDANVERMFDRTKDSTKMTSCLCAEAKFIPTTQPADHERNTKDFRTCK